MKEGLVKNDAGSSFFSVSPFLSSHLLPPPGLIKTTKLWETYPSGCFERGGDIISSIRLRREKGERGVMLLGKGCGRK